MYKYKAIPVRVVDGDTFDFELDLGFHIKKKVRIRLKDFDAPEVRGVEREEGLKSKAAADFEIRKAKEIIVETFNDTSFDRWVGNVYLDGVDLKTLLD